LFGFNVFALAALLGFVIVHEADHLTTGLGDLVLATVLLTALAFGSGWGMSWAGGGQSADRFAVGMVFVVRNVGIATAIAVTALGHVEFAAFGSAYFVAQVPLLLACVWAYRSQRRAYQQNWPPKCRTRAKSPSSRLSARIARTLNQMLIY
jgi:ACR3 family arsenite efflux pump ArsB